MNPTETVPAPATPKATKGKPDRSRVAACLQSPGRAGKSTLAEILISLLKRHGIEFDAFDADGEHQTLFRRYPDDVGPFEAAGHQEEAFNRLMEAILPEVPVTLVDFPAQATSFILDGLERLSMLDLFARKGIRPTVLIFASDDPMALKSASHAKEFCLDQADYLLIKNPARFTSVDFFKTPMAGWFAERNSPIITMPEAQPSTVAAWSALEKKLRKALPLDAACEHPALSEIKRAELQYLRDRTIAQLEEHAGVILPDASLIKKRTEAPEKGRRRRVDPFDDPNY
jgi:hypothetical protein